MHEVLVNRLGGLSLPRKSVVRLTDHPDMTLDVYRGRKTIQYNTKALQYSYNVYEMDMCSTTGMNLYMMGDMELTYPFQHGVVGWCDDAR